MNDFLVLVERYAEQLTHEFQKASIQGKGTSQEVADFRENFFQTFIERFFPFPYRITKGIVIDSFGGRSDSIDCIICGPAHPHTVDTRGKLTLLLADGVDAAIELKPDISKKSELERGLLQGISIKKLIRFNTPVFFQKRYSPDYLDHTKRVPFFIFAMKAKANILDTGREIIDFYKRNNTPIVEQADGIIVNNEGIFFNTKHDVDWCWSNFEGEDKLGWKFEKWGSNTIAGMLFRINNSYPAQPRMMEPVLSNYVKGFSVVSEIISIP